MLPDGSLMIIGRTDDQVKIRGQRVELGEINSTVQQSGLASVSISLLVHPKSSTSQQLATFYVPVLEKGPSWSLICDCDPTKQATLYQLLKARLPAYMAPTYLIPISAVPLTPSGKVDRTRLRDVFRELPQDRLLLSTDHMVADEDSSQWTDTERAVAGIIAETLNIDADTVGLWTPFPSLGLDSISAIRAAKMMQQRFQRRVPLSLILQKSCVAQLTPALADLTRNEENPTSRLDVFSPAFYSETCQEFKGRNLVVQEILPCTPLQEAMLASPIRGSAYVNKMVFRLRVPPDNMRQFWQTVCQRHGILRTCFVTTDNASHPIAQVVVGKYAPVWNRLLAQELSVDSCVEAQVKTLPPAINSFQPPVSFSAIVTDRVSFLSFVCHHALYDGEAMRRLLFEVEQLVLGGDLQAPPSYAQFLEQALSLPPSVDEFWKGHLENFQPILLQPRSGDLSQEQQTFAGTPGISLSELERSAKALGVSLSSIYQASWACVLSLILNTADLCFGNVFNGRSVAVDNIENLVAPCFNTVPLRVGLSTVKRNIDLIKTLQGLNPLFLKHQFTPLRRIQKQLGLEGNHIFNTLLLLQQRSRPLDGKIWTLEREEGEMDVR